MNSFIFKIIIFRFFTVVSIFLLIWALLDGAGPRIAKSMLNYFNNFYIAMLALAALMSLIIIFVMGLIEVLFEEFIARRLVRRLPTMKSMCGTAVVIRGSTETNGTVVGIFNRLIVIELGRDASDIDKQVVEIHECAHAVKNHLVKSFIFFAIMMGFILSVNYSNKVLIAGGTGTPPSATGFIASILIATASLLLTLNRAFELSADAEVHRVLGPSAADASIARIRDTWLPDPLHPRGRVITLRTGDAIAPHHPLELLGPPTLITAGAATSHAAELVLNTLDVSDRVLQRVAVLMALGLTWIIVVIGVSLIAFLARPLVRRLAGDRLTDRGVTNLTLLISAITGSVLGIAGLWGTQAITVSIPVAIFTNWFIAKHYVGPSALSISLLITLIYIVTSLAVMALLWLIS